MHSSADLRQNGVYMQAYTGFAEVYEEFMDNIPYGEWAEYLTGLLKEYGVNEGIVCELGCGTGSMTRLLRDKGYDMIGIDNSPEMLDVAREHEQTGFFDTDFEEESSEYLQNKEQPSKSVLYLMQDMREFELYGTAAAFVSVCDSINYITDYDELTEVFRLVNNYLDKDGVFIFDLKTEHYFRDVLGDTTIAENRKNCSFIWENSYFEDKKMNQYEITIYKKAYFDDCEYSDENVECREYQETDNAEDLYTRTNEIHTQRAYSLEEIVKALSDAGMEYIAAYNAFTREPADSTSERIYVIAKEKYQKNKKYNS